MAKVNTKKRSQTVPIQSSKNNRKYYFAIALILITWMTFSNVGKNQFIGWDDFVYVTQNKSIELTSENVIHSFLKGEPHGMYVPLTEIGRAHV